MSATFKRVPCLILAVFLCWCDPTEADDSTELTALAEQFFRGVYEGDAAVIDKLASDRIVVSYPIFKKVFKKHSLRGRAEVKRFSERFHQRWTETQVTIDQRVAQDDRVVLVWSFQAREREQPDSPPRSWGGISVFRFDDNGKVIEEIGEESTPGPYERLRLANQGGGSD